MRKVQTGTCQHVTLLASDVREPAVSHKHVVCLHFVVVKCIGAVVNVINRAKQNVESFDEKNISLFRYCGLVFTNNDKCPNSQ